jgi:pimeloyl-ACP methyl ester carboxylesterase
MVLSPAQQAASQYIHMLRSEEAPEVLARDGFAQLRQILLGTRRAPGGVAPEEEARYVEAWSRPGALRAMTNWYRAMPVPPPVLSVQPSSPGDSLLQDSSASSSSSSSSTSSSPSLRASVVNPSYSSLSAEQAAALARIPRIMIAIPTLVVWGMQDHVLRPSLLDGLGEFVPDLKIFRIEGGTHWIPSDSSDKVNAAARGHLDARLG